MPRHSVSQSSIAPYPLRERGVYVEGFTVNGYRWVTSVDDHHEQVRLKTVMPGADIDAVVQDLWDELDRINPLPPSAELKLVVE